MQEEKKENEIPEKEAEVATDIKSFVIDTVAQLVEQHWIGSLKDSEEMLELTYEKALDLYHVRMVRGGIILHETSFIPTYMDAGFKTTDKERIASEMENFLILCGLD